MSHWGSGYWHPVGRAAKDAARHPVMSRAVHSQKELSAQMTTVLRLRSPGLKETRLAVGCNVLKLGERYRKNHYLFVYYC